MPVRITFVAVALLVLAVSASAAAYIAPTKALTYGDVPRRSLRQLHDVQVKNSFDYEFQKGPPPKKADAPAAPPPADSDSAPASKPETVYLVADSKCSKCGKTYTEVQVAKVVTEAKDAAPPPPPKTATPPPPLPPPPPPQHPLLAKLAAFKPG